LRQLLIATTNPGKVREFREMLYGVGDDFGFQFSDLSRHRGFEPVEETGATFKDNAMLKAAGYATRFDTWALADDSGLEVDALDGKPGVHSARWAAMHGAGEGDAANNAMLLRQLENVPDGRRTARFVCWLALADPRGQIILRARGTVAGGILRSPRGANGFGYDPLFLVESLGKTTAELTPDEKHAVSHRGEALRRMRSAMSAIRLPAEETRGQGDKETR
jgi:XTP/dITP diphosphohydrolase